MRIDSNFDEGVTFLMVAGDVDVATADELRQAGEQAITEATGTLRIDLSGVTFLDSSGIAALVRIRNTAADSTTLILENPPPRVVKVLELTGLADVFTIERAPDVLPASA